MNAAHDGADPGAPEQLSRFDLNLLVSLDALARERNVTRAAARLGVTQSAMSHMLRKLRDSIGDPLLVRGQGGMVLTPRAAALVVPLQSALRTLGQALSEREPFAPERSTRTFRIASPDLFDVAVVPPLLARIRTNAPGVGLSIVPVGSERLAERLETGEIDVAVVPRLEATQGAPPAQGLVQTTLFRDGFACWMRSDHPALSRRSKLSLAQYAALPHMLVTPRGDGLGQVDEALAERGLSRRIVVRVPHFFTALSIVARSDLVLTAPTMLGTVAEPYPQLTAKVPPLPLPRHQVNLQWHERFSSDPAHRWLRDRIAEVARALQQQLKGPPRKPES